jgi:hypothetical protein
MTGEEAAAVKYIINYAQLSSAHCISSLFYEEGEKIFPYNSIALHRYNISDKLSC